MPTLNTVKLELNEDELMIIRNAINCICANYISDAVDITKCQQDKDAYMRLYDRACRLRNKIYDECFAD